MCQVIFQCKDRGREQRMRVGKRLIKSQVVSHKTSGTEEKQHKGNGIKQKDSRILYKNKKNVLKIIKISRKRSFLWILIRTIEHVSNACGRTQ